MLIGPAPAALHTMSLPLRPAVPTLSLPCQLCEIVSPWTPDLLLQPLILKALPLRPAMPTLSSPGQLGRVQHVP